MKFTNVLHCDVINVVGVEVPISEIWMRHLQQYVNAKFLLHILKRKHTFPLQNILHTRTQTERLVGWWSLWVMKSFIFISSPAQILNEIPNEREGWEVSRLSKDHEEWEHNNSFALSYSIESQRPSTVLSGILTCGYWGIMPCLFPLTRLHNWSYCVATNVKIFLEAFPWKL